jgi:Histidine kinase
MKRRAAPFRLPVLAQDALLGLLVAVMQVQGTSTTARTAEVVSRPLRDLGHLGYVLLIVSGLVLTVRRRWPVPVFITAALASLLYYAAGFVDGPGWLGLFVALYTLTAYGDGRRSLRIAGGGVAVLTVGWLVTGADVEPKAALGWVFFRIAASVMAAALGESFRSRRVIAAEALERARQAERTREEEARSRVGAERLRIAREVHDTVAHAIAIINVQAGVTAYLLDKRPERAREALIAIEQTSAQALHEMRAILHCPHPCQPRYGETGGARPRATGRHRVPDRVGQRPAMNIRRRCLATPATSTALHRRSHRSSTEGAHLRALSPPG